MAATVRHIVLLFLGVQFYHGNASDCNRRHVTVAELKDIVIGRCVDYQTTIHPEHFCSSGVRNCTQLWDKLSSAFLDVHQCNVTADLYNDFIAAADHPLTGKQLFSSGLGGFVTRYSTGGQRYTTVTDTLIGYLTNDLVFCGGRAGDNATLPCERWNPATCPNTATGDFWVAASVNFAKHADRHVYAMMNVTRDPIYKNTSYFAKYEVPNLQLGVVRSVTVILINDSPVNKRDPCKTDNSLGILKTTLSSRNITFKCEENPRDLVYMYCMDNTDRDLCRNSIPHMIGRGPRIQGQHSFLLLMVVAVAIKTHDTYL